MNAEITEKKPPLVIRPDSGYTPYLAFHQNKFGNFTLHWVETLGHKAVITLTPEESAKLVEWIAK